MKTRRNASVRRSDAAAKVGRGLFRRLAEMRKLWKAFLVALAVIGGVVSILTLIPRITIAESAGPIDKSNQYSMAFTITNNSPFTLYDTDIRVVL